MQIIEKPWGKEELLEVNGAYMLKRLTMHKGHRCSVQYHEFKTETIYVLSGSLNILSAPQGQPLTSKIYGPNESVTIPVGIVHRMEAVEDCIYLEASTPHLDDVIRLQDDYNRASQ